MLSLNPGSVCDVCAEDFRPGYLPHCIPCGHVLCATCCTTIVEKTSPRLSPVCPFCRESFTTESVRKIRIDFTTPASGRNTPRHATVEAPPLPAFIELKADRLPPSEKDRRAEARRLEEKVAVIAAKRCSVDEVATLQKEIDDWIRAADAADERPSSLILSSLLLRAILMNYHAHADATKQAKAIENNLKTQIDELESAAGNLQVELRKLKAQQTQKAQECQTLRAELNRAKVRAEAPLLGMSVSTGSSGYTSSGSGSGPASPASPTFGRSASPLMSPSPSFRHQTTSPLASPPVSHAQTPVVSPLSTPLGSPAPPQTPTFSGPRYTGSSVSASASAGTFRSPSAAPRSSSSAHPTAPRPTSPSPSARPGSVRRQSIISAPKMLRSASDEEAAHERERSAARAQERERERHRAAQPAAPADDRAARKEREREGQDKYGYLLHRRWLPTSNDADRSPSAPPGMGAGRYGTTYEPSGRGHTRTPSGHHHATSPLASARAAAAAPSRLVPLRAA